MLIWLCGKRRKTIGIKTLGGRWRSTWSDKDLTASSIWTRIRPELGLKRRSRRFHAPEFMKTIRCRIRERWAARLLTSSPEKVPGRHPPKPSTTWSRGKRPTPNAQRPTLNRNPRPPPSHHPHPTLFTESPRAGRARRRRGRPRRARSGERSGSTCATPWRRCGC